MSEGTISETPLFRPAFSTSSPFCRIPTRRETRKIQHPRELFSPYAFAPYHFIQQRRERFVSTPRPHQPFKPSSSGRGKNPSWEKSSFSGLFSILYFSFFLSFSTRNSKFHRYPVKLLGRGGRKENSTSRKNNKWVSQSSNRIRWERKNNRQDCFIEMLGS